MNMTDRKVATRESRKKVLPMPASKSRLSIKREFTQEEYNRIALGLIPLSMDEKWFIFLENDWLYFHRSWTGACIYQLRLENHEGNYSVAEAWVNRDPNQYKCTDDAYDVALISFLIDNFLLGKRTPFPLPSDVPKDLPKGAYQHHISGSGYPEAHVAKHDEDN
jgi:hypothetical protein